MHSGHDMYVWNNIQCRLAENMEHKHSQHVLLSKPEDSQASRVSQSQQVCHLFFRRKNVRAYITNANREGNEDVLKCVYPNLIHVKLSPKKVFIVILDTIKHNSLFIKKKAFPLHWCFKEVTLGISSEACSARFCNPKQCFIKCRGVFWHSKRSRLGWKSMCHNRNF